MNKVLSSTCFWFVFISFFVPVILESLDIREHLSNDLNNDTRNCQLVILTGNVRFWQVMIQKCLKPSKTKAWHRPKSVASPINTTWRENNNIFMCQKPKLLSWSDFMCFVEHRAFKKVKYFGSATIASLHCCFCATQPSVIYVEKENWQQILHSSD